MLLVFNFSSCLSCVKDNIGNSQVLLNTDLFTQKGMRNVNRGRPGQPPENNLSSIYTQNGK